MISPRPDPAQRGVLYPARLPSMNRLPAPGTVAWIVRWFWIPEWDIDAGRTSRQTLLPFPACNLVVEKHMVGISGPTTRQGHRDLTGKGWAVGALLRPGATPYLVDDVTRLTDDYLPYDARGLLSAVTSAMTEPSDDGAHRSRAVREFSRWLAERMPAPSDEDIMVNAMTELIDSDATITRVEDIAVRLGVSIRTVQRLTRSRVGQTPLMLIRRRRLQEAAALLRDDPSVTIADVAAELGYSDQAHLANDFRLVLGLTPTEYRKEHRPR